MRWQQTRFVSVTLILIIDRLQTSSEGCEINELNVNTHVALATRANRLQLTVVDSSGGRRKNGDEEHDIQILSHHPHRFTTLWRWRQRERGGGKWRWNDSPPWLLTLLCRITSSCLACWSHRWHHQWGGQEREGKRGRETSRGGDSERRGMNDRWTREVEGRKRPSERERERGVMKRLDANKVEEEV